MALTVILGPVATARLHDLPLAPLPRAIDHGLAAQARAGRRGGLALGAVLALGALAATPAEAATITVDTFAIDQVAGDGDCDIFEAVANANNNADGTSGDCVAGDPGLDTIVFDGSLSQSTVAMGGNTLVVSEDLVLDGSGVAVLDGEGTDQIIYAPADLTVRNIGFVYGSYLAGGAIGAYGELTVENAEFAYNESVFPGGAIIANEGVSVSDSNFVGNFAKYVGGGAVAAFGDSGTFTNVYAFGNGSVYGVGGALLLAQGDHAISGGVFAFNQATSGGAIAAGEVYNAGGPGNRKGLPPVPLALTISISGGDFYNNQANGNSGGQGPQLKLPVSSYSLGGAVAVVPPQYGAGLAHSLSITGGTDFERNAAVDGIAPLPRAKLPSGPQGIGGAVFAGAPSGPPITAKGPAPDSFDVLFEDASFVNNVGFIGGGATLLASTITVRDSQFQSNIGILLGGGMLAGNKYGGPGNLSADIDVENSDFLGNGAYAFGGGFLFGDTTSVSGVEVRGNGSKYISMGPPPIKGAAKGGPLPAVDCGSDTNDAVAGLGMVGSTSASVSGASIFAENCGAGYVGGLLVSSYGGTVSIAGDTQVYANSAAFGGGALVGAKYGANATVGGRFEDNTAAYGAGGLAIQPEYASTVSVVDVTVSGNQAAYGQGGGILVEAYDANGGVASVVSISGSTVDGNASASGGGIAATNQGGAITKRAGTGKERLRGLAARLGLAVGAGNRAASAKGDPRPLLDLDVVNSTIDGNSVAIPVPTKAAKGAPGAGFGGGIAVDGTDLGLLFTTVSSNQAEAEGGGLAEAGVVGNTIAIRNSVFAGNSATASDDVSGSAGADYSLFGDAGFVPASGANNQVGVDALLGPLQDNGGPTFTRLPDASSPAIDSADPAFAPPPDFDQRGTGFPRVIGAAADKGAVEQPPPTPEVVSLVIDPDSFAEDGGSTLTVSLDIAPTADVPVTVAFSGTAVLDTDFASGDDDGVAPGVQVVVPSGSTSGSVALTGLEDAIDEPDEPFTATVTAAVGADLPGAPVSDTGTVLDNDAAPSTTVGLSLQDVPEDGGTTQIILTLSNPSDEDVVITLGFSGEATFGVDYTVEDQDPGTPGIQVIIPAGSTTGSVLLTSIEDGTDENDESVIVSIESVSGGGATGSGTAQGSLIDPAGGGGAGPAPLPQPTIVPTLSPWMLLLLGLILPAAVMRRLGGK